MGAHLWQSTRSGPSGAIASGLPNRGVSESDSELQDPNEPGEGLKQGPQVGDRPVQEQMRVGRDGPLTSPETKPPWQPDTAWGSPSLCPESQR